LNILASDEEIDKAFNALLLDIDPNRIALIKRLGQKYNTYVLSNTSNIHIIEVNKILERCTGEKRLEDLFTRLFLSYEMGKAKPHTDIYEAVLAEAGLDPAETLF
jgi:putative hydrolase of the HAD superfamily